MSYTMFESAPPTTSNVSPKGQVTVPAAMRKALGIKPGGKVRFVRKGKQVLIEAYEEPPISSLFGILKARKGKGAPDIDKAIDEAMHQRFAHLGRRRTPAK
ncbi:AbrB/MazE/SpoVT family DNA-binding domain-containing protein [Panacagrimonas sp.]|uniref:AbrB/MazE/SpoVT family DNA-binding domain-containing protein n=1 Tax=Panacagrimonas sp. TaxID=2480088 RepID=UPI003B52EE7D